MRSNKRYTNTAFTKHGEAKADRRPARGTAEPAVCTVCGAVYINRRWTTAETVRKRGKHRHGPTAPSVICSACRQQRIGTARGYVHLNGDFLTTHRVEIERLLRNEAGRAAENNPLVRILGWAKGDPARLVVTTTTEHLAQRLGHALEKSFGGQVRYGFSHENKLAHVWWHRD